MTNEQVKIAIIDDHALIREGIKMIVHSIPNYEVTCECSNGKEFVDRIGQTDTVVDIVLLDIRMPEMDGYETAAWISANHPKIKILALSTMDEETAIIKMLQNGAKGYILKNAAPEELKKATKSVLEEGFYYNEQISHKVMNSIQDIFNNNSTLSTLLMLNENEKQFLELACSEMNYAEIARQMHLSPRTIDGYRDALFTKFNVKTRVGLVIFAIKHGIVDISNK